LVSGVLFSRLNSEGHEVLILAIGNGLVGFGMLILAIGRPLGLVVFALLLAGIGLGPADIAMFGLRQRKTDPRLFGRALAVSMAFNSIGSPLGAAVAGALVAGNMLATAFVLGGILTMLAVLLAVILIPLNE
jgi:predicted MFS family arabinose efflux permease